MEDRHKIEGNPGPSTDPEPSIPSGNHSTANTLHEGSWDDGTMFKVPGAPSPSSDPEPTAKRHEQRNPTGWHPEKFKVPGNPAPSTNPSQEP